MLQAANIKESGQKMGLAEYGVLEAAALDRLSRLAATG